MEEGIIMEKQRRLAISCTTLEALENCIREQCNVICIEEPLYTQDREQWSAISGIADYSITEYASMHFSMLLKVHGANQFDSRRYEVYYFPLHGRRS